MARRVPVNRLNSVDLPTLGRPTSTTVRFPGVFWLAVRGLEGVCRDLRRRLTA